MMSAATGAHQPSELPDFQAQEYRCGTEAAVPLRPAVPGQSAVYAGNIESEYRSGRFHRNGSIYLPPVSLERQFEQSNWSLARE